jgi:hypothetical protein
MPGDYKFNELWQSRGTDVASPAVVPVSSSGGAAHRWTTVESVALMTYRIPFVDPSPDRDDHCGEPKLLAPPAIIRKVTFQWPPDCLWPLRDRTSDGGR